MMRPFFAAAILALTSEAIISTGAPAVPSQLYQVSIIIYGEHVCGGALVSQKHIVSAGRCLYSRNAFPYEYAISIGSYLRPEDGQMIHLSDSVHHPYYKPWEIHWDVAVGTLEKIVKLSSFVLPISLVPANQEPLPEDTLTISGWGEKPRDGRGDVLQLHNVHAVRREDCAVFKKAYAKAMNETMLCVNGSAGKNSDEGAPLVNGKRQLVGISTRLPTRYPGLYANLAYPPIHTFITENTLSSIEPHSQTDIF